jgi:protein-S-isoprenylcysteine O-methyltransferase Ste14
MYVRLAKREEKDMEAEFGQQYREYMGRTGRLVPRISG